MNFHFTILQLVTVLLILFGVAVGICIIMVLYKLNKTIEKVNSIVDSNADNINKTINVLPSICSNINDITASVKNKTDALDGLLAGSDEAAASSAISGLESIISSVTSIIDIFNEIKGFFGSKKKRIFKIKR